MKMIPIDPKDFDKALLSHLKTAKECNCEFCQWRRATIKTILDEIEQCAQGGVCNECDCYEMDVEVLECFYGNCPWWNRKKKEWLNNTI